MSLCFHNLCFLSSRLVMMFRFMVVMYYLSSMGNEFICSQWERNGMDTDVYFSG